jgi:hypothetical protein
LSASLTSSSSLLPRRLRGQALRIGAPSHPSRGHAFGQGGAQSLPWGLLAVVCALLGLDRSGTGRSQAGKGPDASSSEIEQSRKRALPRTSTSESEHFRKRALPKASTSESEHFRKRALLKVSTSENEHFRKRALQKASASEGEEFRKRSDNPHASYLSESEQFRKLMQQHSVRGC